MPKTIAHAALQPHAGFAETEFLYDEDDSDYTGFAPTQLMTVERRRPSPRPAAVRESREAWMPAGWTTVRAEEPRDAARQAQAARVARSALQAAASSSRLPVRRGWFARLEDTLDRLLPGNLGSLLQLFICVSLSMALISALLPLVDRI